MHVLLTFLVNAESKEEATGLVEEALNDMAEMGYIDSYDGSDARRVVPVSSFDGRRLLMDCRNYLWSQFKERIQIIRAVLETFSDGEIFNKKPKPEKEIALKLKGNERILTDMRMFQYWCKALSNYNPVDSAAVFVFNDGSWMSIGNGAEFDELAKEAKYIATVDVHC